MAVRLWLGSPRPPADRCSEVIEDHAKSALAKIEQTFDTGSMAIDASLNSIDGLGHSSLRLLGERTRPINLAGERQLPVAPALAEVLPGGGLSRGAMVASIGSGSMSLAMALVAGPSAAGSWSAIVGVPSFGLLAAAELGVSLERVVLVERPEPSLWATVVAALLDAFEVVVVRPEQRVGAADHRRLRARARERGAVLVQAGGRVDAWPEAPELQLSLVAEKWQGVGPGHGHLQARRVTVEVTGRRGAGRPHRAELWLPGPDGRPALVTGSAGTRADRDRPTDHADRHGRSTPSVDAVGVGRAIAQPLREVG